MADWTATLRDVAAVAPNIAGLFGGPLASAAVTLVGRLLLGKPEDAATTPAEAQAALAQALTTPEGLIKLKELELHAEELRNKLQVDLRAQDLSNTMDARARAVAMRDTTPGRLAMLTIPLFFAMVGLVLFGSYMLLTNQVTMPESARELQLCMATLIGSMVTMVGGFVKEIYSYFFGGSLDNSDRNGPVGDAVRQLGIAATAKRNTTDDLNSRSLDASRR